MKIFISWSGKTNQKIALVLRNWLPNVIQQVEPFVSSMDISKGDRWNKRLDIELKGTKFSIICVTKFNMNSEWLNFEAGALSNTSENAKVCPFLVGLSNNDLTGPLTQFQTAVADHNEEEVFKLLASIRDTFELNVSNDVLKKSFDLHYKDLLEQLKGTTKHYMEDVSERNARVVEKNSLFVSTPMSSLGKNEEKYAVHRREIIDVINSLRGGSFNFSKVVSPIEECPTITEFSDPENATANDLISLQKSEYFLCIMTKSLASSTLVEIGYAIAQNKKCVIIIKNRNNLPFILRDADKRISNFKIYQLDGKLDNFVSKKGTAAFRFERI